MVSDYFGRWSARPERLSGKGEGREGRAAANESHRPAQLRVGSRLLSEPSGADAQRGEHSDECLARRSSAPAWSASTVRYCQGLQQCGAVSAAVQGAVCVHQRSMAAKVVHRWAVEQSQTSLAGAVTSQRKVDKSRLLRHGLDVDTNTCSCEVYQLPYSCALLLYTT